MGWEESLAHKYSDPRVAATNAGCKNLLVSPCACLAMLGPFSQLKRGTRGKRIMQAQRQEAGIIKELEGSKCEELGSISKNWPQRTKRGGGGMVVEEESKSNPVN